MRSFYFTYLLIFLLLPPASVCWANDHLPDEKRDIFNKTGLPLPRFVSIEDSKAYVRAGPGEKYPIKWIIERQGLPVEITLEFENWRKIKDIDGQEGWIYHGLLSGKRTGLVKSKKPAPVYQEPYDNINEDSRLAMKLEPMVLLQIQECQGNWCNVESSGFSGWLQRKYIWGVYESENFD